MSNILGVWLLGERVGILEQERGRIRFSYEEGYISKPEPMALSVSIPVQEERYEDDVKRAFFAGLLPDDLVRHRLAKLLGISEKNSFGLLEANGGRE